jgi:hypothetical protein
MKILTLTRKCGNYLILFARFKVDTVLQLYCYWGGRDLDDEKLSLIKSVFNFTPDLHNLSDYPAKNLALGLQLKRKAESIYYVYPQGKRAVNEV